MIANIEFLPILKVSAAFGLLFILAEAWKRFLNPDPELTRKFVHLSGGVICSFFPFLFSSSASVLILCVVFAAIIVVAKKLGLLKSVHGVSRVSEGAWCFPVAVFFLFFAGRSHPILYMISILVLAFADSFAALVGQSYGHISFDVETNKKTLEGSVVFWAVAFLCVHIPLLLFTDIGRPESILASFIVAVLVTALESVSFRGLDNIFVPFLSYYTLIRLTTKPAGELLYQVGIITSIVILSFLFRIRTPLVIGSGQAGLVLLLYAAWSLCDIRWFWPLFLGALGIKGLILLYQRLEPNRVWKFGVRRFVLAGAGPFAVIFLSNALKDYDLLFVPYIAGCLTLGFVLSKNVLTANGNEITAKEIKRALLFLPWAAVVPVVAFCRAFFIQATFEIVLACLPVLLVHRWFDRRMHTNQDALAWIPFADFAMTVLLAFGVQVLIR